MAAVTFTDGAKKNINGANSELEEFLWISPASMDSADTVVLPTIAGKTPYLIACWDQTSGDAVTFTLSTQTVTIDAAGGTTNHVYVLRYGYA